MGGGWERGGRLCTNHVKLNTITRITYMIQRLQRKKKNELEIKLRYKKNWIYFFETRLIEEDGESKSDVT